MTQVTEADHLYQFKKVYKVVQIQKLLNRQKRRDRPPKRKDSTVSLVVFKYLIIYLFTL